MLQSLLSRCILSCPGAVPAARGVIPDKMCIRDRYTVEELREVCLWLTEEVNTWSAQVSRGQDGQMELKGSPEKKTVEAMEGLGEIYPQLGGYYPCL